MLWRSVRSGRSSRQGAERRAPGCERARTQFDRALGVRLAPRRGGRFPAPRSAPSRPPADRCTHQIELIGIAGGDAIVVDRGAQVFAGAGVAPLQRSAPLARPASAGSARAHRCATRHDAPPASRRSRRIARPRSRAWPVATVRRNCCWNSAKLPIRVGVIDRAFQRAADKGGDRRGQTLDRGAPDQGSDDSVTTSSGPVLEASIESSTRLLNRRIWAATAWPRAWPRTRRVRLLRAIRSCWSHRSMRQMLSSARE